MKSFKNFVHIVEAEQKQKTRINISGQEILPMQPEVESPTTKSKGVKQSEVSADIKAKAADKKKLEAIKKGYVSPEGRVQERGVIVNRIRSGAYGYGDPGKDPTKYGINPREITQTKSSLFKRAVDPSKSVRKSARKEIRTAISSIEKRYPGSTERTGTSFRGFSRSVGYTPSKSDISILQRMARPETSGQSAKRLFSQLGQGAVNRGQAAADAARDIAAEPQRQAQQAAKRSASKSKGFADLEKVIGKSEVTLPKPKLTKVQVQPKVSKPISTSAALKPKIQKPAALTRAQVQPKASTALKAAAVSSSSTVDDFSKAASKLISQERAARQAEKAAKALQVAKTWRAAGRAAGIVGAGIEGKAAYDIARAEGSSKKRAIGAGIARAAGGFIGGGIGAAAGTALGLPGAIAGGVGGYGAGTEIATKAYKAVTGDPGKKLTTQGVLSNIRTAVPREIRAQVPANVRKGFTDFVKSAGRTYGNWSRSQEAKK